MKKILVLAMMVAFIGLPLRAQEEGGGKVEKAVEEQGSGEETEMGKLLRAIRLPEAAELARREGVPAAEVKEVLEAARSRNLPASDTETILVEETRAVREKGQIDGFGSFVRSKLDEGLRGRELSDAIRAEHAARGKGKGQGKADRRGSGRAGTDRLEEGVAEGEDAVRGQKKKAEKPKRKPEKQQAGEQPPPDGDKY
jgi:hypothetical protein